MPQVHQNDSNTFCKLLLLEWLFLWLQTLLRNPHCLSAGSDSLAVQTYSLNSWGAYVNAPPRFKKWHFPTPLRHIEKHQFYWNRATLPLQSSSLQSPKCNFGKFTQRLGQFGFWPTCYCTVQKRGPLPPKWFRLWNNRFTSFWTKKSVYVSKCRMQFWSKIFQFGKSIFAD